MKHCIKLCTKIQIYYSYCIPFSTDFLVCFSNSAGNSTSKLARPGRCGFLWTSFWGAAVRGMWAPLGSWLAEGTGRSAGTHSIPGGFGSQMVFWHSSIPHRHPAGPQGTTYLLQPAPGAWCGARSCRALHCHPPSSLHTPWPHPRTVVPLCSLLPLALLPGLAQCLGPALPGPPQSPWGPCPGPCKEPQLLALRHGQC